MLLLVRARHEQAAVLLKQMKEAFVELQEKAAAEEGVTIKKKCLMLRKARLALLKEHTSLTPFEASLKARVVVREQIKQAAAAEAAAAADKENKQREKEHVKEAKDRAKEVAKQARSAKSKAGTAAKGNGPRALSVSIGPEMAEPKRDASQSPETKPAPKRQNGAARKGAKAAASKLLAKLRAPKPTRTSKPASKKTASPPPAAARVAPKRRRPEPEPTKTTTRGGRNTTRMRF